MASHGVHLIGWPPRAAANEVRAYLAAGATPHRKAFSAKFPAETLISCNNSLKTTHKAATIALNDGKLLQKYEESYLSEFTLQIKLFHDIFL